MACRQRASPSELVRLVATGEGTVAVGRSLPGRGAWLCADSLDCLDQAVRRGSVSRALRTTVDPDALRRAVGGAGKA